MDIIVNANIDKPALKSSSIDGYNDYFHNIISQLGFDMLKPPLANFLSQYHNLAGNWLIASPMHWEASHNDATITCAIELKDSDSKVFFAAVNDFLKDDYFKVYYLSHDKWLFNIDGKPAIHSVALDKVFSQSLMPILAKLDGTLYWQRLFTEMQMFLNAHHLNQTIADSEKINGLWFWGEGEFIWPNKRVVYTDDERLLQLWPFLNKLDSKSRLRKKDLIILQNKKAIDDFNLKAKAKKFKTNWYWNNLAYRSLSKYWHWW